VTGPGIEFVLAAIWAQKHTYVERLHDVLDAYAPLLRSHETVLAGDFNSNAVFDRKHGDKSHTRLVERLRDFGLVSVYHSLRSEPHGAETENTYFHCRRIGQPYHLDYVFVPREWLPRIRSCSVGDAATWLEHSDHCPVVVDVAAG
jgi:endonuclease/exonuclease/phosphatase family metal-dependent hydrolase